MKPWVTNASPLIFLAKLDRLDVLQRAASRVLVPSAVVGEITARADEASVQIETALETWLHQQDPSSQERLSLLSQEIGQGEAAAIALGVEVQADRLVLDDLDARRWARRLKLRPVGTLGLLLAARLRGEIPSLEAEIHRLLEVGFRASAALVAAVLQEAGER